MPRVTITLFVVTCAFSIAGLAAPDLQALLRLTPNWLATGQIWRPFTANLLHSFPLHLVVNMVALMLAGPAAEAAFGPKLYLGVYVASGLGGCIAQSAIGHTGAVGASTAIAGVFGAMFAWGYAHRSQPSGVRQMVIASILSVLVLASGPVLNCITVPGHGHIRVGNYGHIGGFLTGLGISSLVLILRSQRAVQPAGAANGSQPVQRFMKPWTLLDLGFTLAGLLAGVAMGIWTSLSLFYGHGGILGGRIAAAFVLTGIMLMQIVRWKAGRKKDDKP